MKKFILIALIYLSGVVSAYYLHKHNIKENNIEQQKKFPSLTILTFSRQDQFFIAGISLFSWPSFAAAIVVTIVDHADDLSKKQPL